MQHIDIATLLRDALQLSGCTDEQVGTFDGHSTIELELESMPNIYMGVIDDGLWFWSQLVESGDMLLGHCSQSLLRFLMQGCGFARTEQMQLAEIDGQLQVRVLLAESAYANAEQLATTIEDYLAALTTLCEIIRQ
jgi:hypothetical protein